VENTFDSALSPGVVWKPAESALPEPDAFSVAALRVQRLVGWLLLLPFAGFLVFLMRWFRGYRIADRERLRREFKAITADKGPLLICANHLTFIDSALMLWAFGSNPWYFLHFRAFSWNLPAGDFFKKKFYFRVVAFLNKCIFIHRDGSKQHKDSILGMCRYLLSRGEIVSVFPEGRRSRSGRFDREKITFGVGKVLSTIPGCRVLCVYLRGDKQVGYSDYPAKDSVFHVTTKVIRPATSATGRQAYFELVSEIADAIEGMETAYFRGRP